LLTVTAFPLDALTVFIRHTYHGVMPYMYPPPSYELGRTLNVTEEAGIPPNFTSTPEGHRILSVNELIQDSEGRQYRVLDVLGNGTYSYVFKCESMNDPGRFYAVKVLKNLPQYKDTGINEIMMHNILMDGADHPGKAQVMIPLTSFEIDDHIFLVMPLLYRSLFDGLCQMMPPLRRLALVRRIMWQLLQALDFIHNLGVIHCDVKTDNILFCDEAFEDIVLIDFGSATAHPCIIGSYIQSRFYRSPEIILGLSYGPAIDVWSAGCVAAELFLDFAIFGCETEFDSIHAMVGLLGPFPEKLLLKSQRWQRFFAIAPHGFIPKGDPVEVLMQSHCYHQIFEQVGPQPLEELIAEHFPIAEAEEIATVACFGDFVRRLLAYEQDERLTAKQALAHPFITEEFYDPAWTPPDVPPLRTADRQEPGDLTPVMALPPTDFLCLM
jgi:dual specificity protein kinase YAK1